MNILVIDDEPDICQSLTGFLNRLGHTVSSAANGEEGLKVFHAGEFDVIITDIRMPVMDGIELLKRIKTVERAPVDVIVFTGHGDMDNAVKALQYGAYDYLHKPVNVKELAITLERSAEYADLRRNYHRLKHEFEIKVDEAVQNCRGEAERLRKAYLDEIGLGRLQVFSEAMRQVLDQAEKYSRDRTMPVLIEGESGTGKELIARYMHHFSPASTTAPFVAVNCGAFVESLIEAELFGHESGAFTGADRKGRQGKLEAAHGGTVFFDEIAEMPLNLQVKLLRVLEEQRIYRLGGVREIPIDIRIICATNKDLKKAVEENRFRLDLYYRISTGTIRIPPLRSRPEAIIPFAVHFARRAFSRQGKIFQQFSPEAETLLREHQWPGNVRQLKNAMVRLALMKSDGTIERRDLEFIDDIRFRNPDGHETHRETGSIESLRLPEDEFDLDDFNRRIIEQALEKFAGNQTRAAAYLKLTRRQLQGRVKKWNISVS